MSLNPPDGYLWFRLKLGNNPKREGGFSWSMCVSSLLKALNDTELIYSGGAFILHCDIILRNMNGGLHAHMRFTVQPFEGFFILIKPATFKF